MICFRLPVSGYRLLQPPKQTPNMTLNKFILSALILLIVTTALVSFKSTETTLFEFSYPKRDGTAITIRATDFKKFKKEWRGQDYYYYGESKSGMICSILYYKLNDDEIVSLIDAPKKAMDGPDISPVYPFAYFSNYSNLKKYEKNNVDWGQPSDDFMFRQNDITEFAGAKINQKHMYGYSMVDKDLFVNVHLSKTGYSEADSTAMREILNTLTRKK